MLQIDTQRRCVVLPATLHLRAFAQSDPPGHHLLTWGGGRAGPKALLKSPVSDAAVLSALEKLGAKPGDNLREEAWTRRADPSHPAPDARAKGTQLEIKLVLPDRSRKPIRALLVDLDKRSFDWRLAGNRALIPVWKSGCIVCLQSCPGAKVGNAKATMRDLHKKRSRFQASKLAKSLGEGRQLKVEIYVVKEKKPTPAKKTAKERDKASQEEGH